MYVESYCKTVIFLYFYNNIPNNGNNKNTHFSLTANTKKGLFEVLILKVRATCKTNTTAHLTAKQIKEKS